MRSGKSALAILWVVVLHAGVLAAQEGPQIFEMPRLNQVYSDVVREVLPIRQGPITVQLKFLEHSVELKDHRLEVTRDAMANSHNFRVVVTLEGEAEVESRLEMAGLPANLKDEIRLPLQSISVAGRAEVSRDPEGYLISPIELPPFVQVEIESQLAEKMVGLCKGLAFLPGFGSACEGLKQSLAFIRLPLPEPGDTYLVPLDLLTEAEITEFDRYLDVSGTSIVAAQWDPSESQ
jgi:hypothetical protein